MKHAASSGKCFIGDFRSLNMQTTNSVINALWHRRGNKQVTKEEEAVKPDSIWSDRTILRLYFDSRVCQGHPPVHQVGIRLRRYSSTAAVPLAKTAARGVRNGFPSSRSVLEKQRDFELLVLKFFFLLPTHSRTAYRFFNLLKFISNSSSVLLKEF